MSGNELQVQVDGVPVGRLFYENYDYSFRYDDPSQLDPKRHLVSLTMPVRGRAYETQVLPPPFQSALPEGELLAQLQSRFGKALSLGDDFSLLRLVGHTTVGRITFSDPNVPPPAAPEDFDLATVLKHPDTKELFNALVQAYGFRFGVGGVQPKALLGALRQATVPTGELLLKLAGRDYPHLPVNEHFCLQASRAAGLPTAASDLSDNQDLLAVHRFDLSPDCERLAFEEMCALRQRSRHGKYDGGYEDIATVIRQIPCDNAPATLRDFFGMVALSMTIRNGDAHLKNFGIVYDTTDCVQLAPSYDLVTTTAYIASDHPALSFAGRKVWPNREVLEKFGTVACGLRKKVVRETLERITDGVSRTLAEVEQHGRDHPPLQALCQRMAEQWRLGLTTLEVKGR